MPKKVGILGSGDVGQALGRAFVETGYEVKIGSRTPEKLESLIKQVGSMAQSGTFNETASFGDIVVLAVHGEAALHAIDLAGPNNFSGKLVIDTTNPLDFSKGMPPTLLQAFSTRSIGESVQERLHDARVVKCFNTVPSSQMFRPKFSRASMLVCGNDSKAKQEATQILKQFGWTGSIDVGGIGEAKYLESLVLLWIRAVMAVQSFDSMFVLVKE